jgi:hypothetical protein
MAKNTISIGNILLQAALAAVLVTAGLSVFMGGWGDEMVRSIKGVFGNNGVRDAVMYVLAVVEIAAGVFLVLDLFRIKSLDKFDDLALLVVIIAWCVFMVLADALPLFSGRIVFMKWLGALAQHTLVLASMITIKAKM